MTFEKFEAAIRIACLKAAEERGENLANLSCLFKNWRHLVSAEAEKTAA
jgi:hypothetical protein